MATTYRKTIMRCGSPAPTISAMLGVFCAFMFPNVFAMALFVVIQLSYWAFIVATILAVAKATYVAYLCAKVLFHIGQYVYYSALVKVQRATYHHSSPESVNDDVKPQTLDITTLLKDLENALWSTKHIAASNLIATCATARTKTAKIAALFGLWQLYSCQPPSDTVNDFIMENYQHCVDAVTWISEYIEKRDLTGEFTRIKDKYLGNKSESNDEVVEQSNDEVTTLTEFIRSHTAKERENGASAQWIAQNKGLVAAACTVAAFIMSSVAMSSLVGGDKQHTLASKLIEYGRLITAKKIIGGQVQEMTEGLLSLIYACIGKTYVPPGEEQIAAVQEEILNISKKLQEIETQVSSDFFGLMRSNHLALVDDQMKNVEKMYKDLSQLQKSQYNLTTLMQSIRTGYEALVQKQRDLVANATGKQEPIVIAFVGDPGHGKTELMRQTVKFLEDKYQIQTYFRNVNEEYWSNFCGQQILVWDDMGLTKEGKEYSEFSYHTQGAPSSVVGAAISDKGKRTNPLFILTTSNHCYLGPQGHNMATPDAYHRRRNIVIRVENSKAAEYMATHGTTIPSHLFDESKTTLTLMRSVPLNGNIEIQANVLGVTNIERIHASLVEFEKNACNRFKQALRVKPYYKGNIPEDEVVNTEMCTEKYLTTGKFTPTNAPDTMSQESDVFEQAINPVTISTTRKHPFVLISGPSGAGKTHFARTIVQNFNPNLDPIITSTGFPVLESGKAYIVDDITLSPERYSDSITWLNQVYEEGKPAIVVVTENADKTHNVDQSIVAEIHRRAHVFSLRWKYGWTEYFQPPKYFALKHKKDIGELGAIPAQTKNLVLRATEYSKEQEDLNVSSCVSYAVQLAGNKYGDDILQEEEWTLPMPKDIDFSVHLRKNFSEMRDETPATLMKAVLTGSLFSVTNITGRFSHLGLITGLKTLFAQAPNFGTNCIRETVTSFNRAQVESKFSEKGTALLTTPEGSVGVRWDTRNVRMFSVSENHDLAQKGIDVMSYFNPNVANVYKDLIEGVVFSEKTVQEIEQLIQSQREESFKEKSIISVLFRSTAVLVSLAAQIIAPLALFRESVNQLNDRNELNYFRACNRYEQKLKTPTQHAPKIKIGTTEIAIHDFEKALGTGMVNEEDAIHILEANPHAVQHVNHSTTHFTNIRSVLKQNIGIETYPSIRTLEARTSQPSTIDTYGNGSPRQLKKPNENVELEAFNSRAEYDAWVARTYGADSFDGERAEWAITMDADADWERIHEDYELYHTVDDAPIERIAPHEAEEYVCHGKSWADEDWGIDDESSPEPKKKKLVKKITIESSPEPGKTKKRMVIHVQSSPEPKKKKKTEQVHMQSVKIQFGTEDDIGKYRKFDVQKGYELYTFMEKDGYVCCQGKRPEIRNVVRQYSVAARYKWAVYMVSDDATPQEIINKIGLVKPEVAESELKHGDIIKIRRTMAGVPYVHFGVIGPSPLEEGKTVLYHVQPMNNGGASSAVIAVDDLAILNLAEWEIHHPDTMCHKEEGFRCIRKYREFGHLKQHAYNTFAYNGFTSNCETWALSMVYDTQSVNVFKRQQIPEYFIPLLEIVKTFKTVEPEFVGQIEEMVAVEQSCLDSTALRISRETLPPAQVLLCDPQTRITVTRALGIKGKYMLTVGHVKQTRLLVKRMTPEGVKFFEAKRVLVDANMDLSIWEADKQMPAFKDNTKLFMSKAEIKDALAIGTSQVATVGIANIADNAVTINNYTVRIKGQIDQTTDFTKRLGSHGLEYTAVLMGATSESAFTAEGDCGSPLMIYSATAPRKLIGIHRAGSTTKMYAALVPAEWLTYAFSRIVNTQSATVLPGVEMLDEPVLDPMTGLKLVGYSKYPTGPPMGTKIRKVDIEFDAIKTEYEPAILSGKDPRAPGYNPAIKTLTKFCRDVPRLNEREIQEAEKDLIEELKVRLMGKTLKVFTTLASINGPPVSEYPNAGALNRKTGVGWPNNVRDHVTDKQAYLDYCDVDGTELWKIKRNEIGNRLRDDISTLLGVCAAGKRPGVVFSYFPKDEVLKKKKIDDPNTRGILAGTFPYVIAYRRYYLALHLRIQEIFHKIPIKIGIDPHSMDWHELAVYHHEVGDKGFDADAKNWDASIPRRLMESVPVIVNALYQELDPNWRQEDDTIRSALHMAVEAPYILYDNKIVQAPGGQVSGQPGTAFDNSLINWMLCLIIFKRAMRADGKPHLATNKAFNELCRLSVYGDDMMLTVAPEASAMTMEHYIHEAATFGIEITPADKDAGATNTHIHISKMSFLKRNFNRIGKVWVGPIDRNSIAKAILWLRGSGTYIPSMDPTTGRISWPVSQETTVLRQNFTGQLTECALHGRELFENVRRQLNENLLRLGMDVITTTYVDELVNLGIMRA